MKVAVVGASGHTGRFVIDELLRRRFAPIAIARDAQRLRDRGIDLSNVEARITSLDEPTALDRALVDVSAVINCAGPFLDTAQSVVEAALRVGAHYFDVTAEQGSAQRTLEAYDAPARARGIVVVPSVSFFGALADVLSTAAFGEWTSASDVRIAVALDRWWPTAGTRRTGERNTLPRLAMRNGVLTPLGAPSSTTWPFPEPFGVQTVREVPMSETILIARHLRVPEIRHFISEKALDDIHDAATPEPAAADDSGRSAQLFLMESVVRNGSETRRIVARGRDIYAISAPIAVQAVDSVLRGGARGAGAFAPAQLFEPMRFLDSLSSSGLTTSITSAVK